MNWLQKIASPETWLAQMGIPVEFIEYALDDNKFPRKMQKWVAINLAKRYQSSVAESFKPHVAVGIYDEELIEIRDWYNYKSRREQGFDINRYDMDSATRGVHEWAAQMNEERGDGHVRNYKFPQGSKGYEELGNGFIMVDVPAVDLPNEGAIMQHCVGDDEQEYQEAVNEGKTIIYSLRDSAGWPHATIEVTNMAHISELDREEYDQDPENHVFDEAGNLVDIDYNNWHEEERSGTPSWEVVQIQGKQTAPPVSKYHPYLKKWLQTHQDEFSVDENDLLSVSTDEELMEIINADRPNGKTFTDTFSYLSSEGQSSVITEIMQTKGKGWSAGAVAEMLSNFFDIHPFGNDTASKAEFLKTFLSTDYDEAVRAKAAQALTFTLSPLASKKDPQTIQYLKDMVVREQYSPDVARSALNLLSGRDDAGSEHTAPARKGPVKFSYPPDVLPIALDVSDRFEGKPNAEWLQQDILKSAIWSVDYDTAVTLIQRGTSLRGNTFETRRFLGMLETQDFYEIWKRLEPQTQQQLMKEDESKYHGSETIVYDEMNKHQFLLEAWKEHQRNLWNYNVQERGREESKQRGFTINYQNPLGEPAMPEWDNMWLRNEENDAIRAQQHEEMLGQRNQTRRTETRRTAQNWLVKTRETVI